MESYWFDSNGLICLIFVVMVGVILDLFLEFEEEGLFVFMGVSVLLFSLIFFNKFWVDVFMFLVVLFCFLFLEVKGGNKIM